jgi:hypothetical protein
MGMSKLCFGIDLMFYWRISGDEGWIPIVIATNTKVSPIPSSNCFVPALQA